MTQQTINLGTSPGGTGGDAARTAFEKVNANFDELYGGKVSQPLNANLTALASSVWAANQMQYQTSSGAISNFTTTAYGRLFLGVTNAQAARAYIGLGTASTLNVTTASDDDTANALMKVGDFGWGGSAGVSGPVCANVDDFTLPNGLFVCSTGTTGTKPDGQSWGSLLVHGRANSAATSGGRVVQTWYNTDSAVAASWTRNGFNGKWGDWQPGTLTMVGLGLEITPPMAANTDLNTMRTAGFYSQAQNSNASLALNYPVAKAGWLEVGGVSSTITTQKYQEYDTGTLWTRSRYQENWSAWKLQWDNSTLVKTISTTDATVGHMLKVGDFGIGVADTPPRLADVDATGTATGLYSIAAPSGALPRGASTYGVLMVERYNAARITQTYKPNPGATNTFTMWTRAYNADLASGAAWTEWQRHTSDADITAWGYNQNIGSSEPYAYATNVDDFDLRNGLYVVDSSSTGTMPGTQKWGMLLVAGRNFSVGRVVQAWMETDNAGSAIGPRTWRRLNYGRVWGPWVRDLTEADLAGAAFTGGLSVSGTAVFTGTNIQRWINEGSDTAPAVLQRVDASNYYILLTNPSNQMGDFNALRPFSINLVSGMVSMANGASTASPSAGDRSTRVATTTWVGNEISGKQDTIASGTTSQFYRGDHTWQDFGTMARGQALSGLSVSNAAIAASDSFLAAFGKAQGQINAIVETGNDGNGNYYTRFRDGTQLVFGNGNTGTIDANNDIGNTYTPVPFVTAFVDETFKVFAEAYPAGNWDHYGVTACSPSGSGGCAVFIRNGGTGAQTFAIRYFAIGRWK